MEVTRAEILAGAERERYAQLAQAARNRMGDITAAVNRLRTDIENIEVVYRLRFGGAVDGTEAGEELAGRVAKAVAFLREHGGTDGTHHKQWVIAQAYEALTGEAYPGEPGIAP